MSIPLELLLIEDNPSDRRLVREHMRDARAAVRISDCDRLSSAAVRLAGSEVDCVLLDLSLPDATGLEALARVRELAPDVPVVVLSGLEDETLAMEAMSRGAQDYLLKGDADGPLIERSVLYAIERKRSEDDRVAAVRALGESERQRRLLMGAMLRAEAAERTRIATELHDDTVQVMTASLIAIDRLARAARTAGQDTIVRTAESTRAVLEEATERTRRLMFDLRPPILHETGLLPALGALTEQVASEIGGRADVSGSPDRYEHGVEELLYRCAREALTNARKHANPSTLQVRIDALPDRLAVTVADDGRGFDVDSARSRAAAGLHLGLNSIVERIEAAGGSVEIDSAPGRGARIRMTAPATPAAVAAARAV